jgi:hypothetical protein
VKRLALLASVLILAACGTFGAQARTISLAYKAGDTAKYGFHLVMKFTIAASGMSIPLDLDLKALEDVTVKSVDSSGTADLSIAISDVSVTVDEGTTSNTTKTSGPTTIEMKVAKDGQVVSVNGSAFGTSTALPGLSGTQGGVVSAILPDHAVKPGDTWTKSYDQPNPLGGTAFHATSNNTYLRDETVSGVSAAVVESKVSTNLNMTINLGAMLGQTGIGTPSSGGTGGVQSLVMKGTSTSDTTTWIDTGARRIVKTHSSGSVNATLAISGTPPSPATTVPAISGPITFKGTQTLDLTPA